MSRQTPGRQPRIVPGGGLGFPSAPPAGLPTSPRWPPWPKGGQERSVVGFVLRAIAVSLDHDRLPVMHQPVDHGGGQGVVHVEDRAPIPEGAIRRDDDRAAFIPGGDDLEQEVRTALVDGQIGGDDSLGAARGGWSYPPRALCPRSIVPLRLPIDDIPRALPVESRRRNKKNQTSCDDKASCNAAKETRKETQQKCSRPEGDHGRICLPLARNPRRPQARPQPPPRVARADRAGCF